MFEAPVMEWFITSLIVFVIILLAVELINSISKNKKRIMNIAIELDSWVKYCLSLAYVVLISIGIYEFTFYFMLEAATLWAIVFPITIIVIFTPYLLLFLPLFKYTSTWGIFPIILWSMVSALPLTYGINLLITSKMRTTESDVVAYTNGEEVFKYVGGASLVIVAVTAMVLIIIKSVTKKYTKELISEE